MTEYTNSSLASITKISKKFSKGRNADLFYITPHCFVGQVTAAEGANAFYNKKDNASCNYVIGRDGKIALIVEEKNRSWCSGGKNGTFDNGKIFPLHEGGSWNDNRAITIECASDKDAPYKFTDSCYNSLVDLCTDICRRYGKQRLVWAGNLWYQVKSDELAISLHRWFAAKACPGDWLIGKLPELAAEVTRRLQKDNKTPTEDNKTLYRVQTGAFSKKENAEKYAEDLNKKGIKTIIKES